VFSARFWTRRPRNRRQERNKFGHQFCQRSFPQQRARPVFISIFQPRIATNMTVPINIGAVCRDSGKSGEGVVVADVSSAVEGWRPAARKERWKMSAVLKFSSTVGVCEHFLRRAGRPRSTAGRMPAATKSGGELRQCRHELLYTNSQRQSEQNQTLPALSPPKRGEVVQQCGTG
jgi:hypothetical protein